MKSIEKTIYSYLVDYVKTSPDKLFLADENKSYTVEQAYKEINGLANELYYDGVRADSMVALRATRSIETTLLLFAIQAIGALCVLADAHGKTEDYIESCGVDIVPDFSITNDTIENISARDGWRIYGKSKNGKILYNKRIYFVKSQDDELNFNPSSDTHKAAVIVFTSGTTEKSKAVVLSQKNIISVSVDTLNLGWYLKEDIALAILPVHHVFGLSLIVTALVAEYALFFPENTELDYILECIEKYKITRMNGVPSLYYALAKLNEKLKKNVTTLRTGLIGGAPVTGDQFAFIEKSLDVVMIPVYGMSECMGISCASYKDSAEKRSATVGKFYPMGKGCVVDQDGIELSCEIEGEICIKSPALMLEYYGNKDETEAAIDSCGRLHTGDLGYLDQEGYLHISGRKKDIIIRNGINISCGKIEKAIMELPSISEAVVVGIKHDSTGEVPAALCVLCEGYKTSDEEIKEYLKNKLAKNEIPEKIYLTQQVPLTSSGKPDKQKIKEILSNGKRNT